MHEKNTQLLQLNFKSGIFRVASTCDVLRASWVVDTLFHTYKNITFKLELELAILLSKLIFSNYQKKIVVIYDLTKSSLLMSFQKITKLFCSINTQVFFNKLVINELLPPHKITLGSSQSRLEGFQWPQDVFSSSHSLCLSCCLATTYGLILKDPRDY